MGLGSIGAGLAAQPSSGDGPDFSMWWGVFAAFVITPAVLLAVKWIAERRRDRKTRELVEQSNREGPVPDLPEDFSPPQVVERRSRMPWRRKYR